MDILRTDADLSAEVLKEIITAQTEIVKLGQDLGAVMEFVAERLLRLTGAGGTIVELAEDEDMVYRAATGMATAQLGLRLRRQGSLSGMCVESGDILRCDDSETDCRVDRIACRKVGLRSMVVAPLTHGRSVVGALKIASPQPRFFSAQHVEILRLMSELIASAMYFAAQHETDELYHRATHDVLTGLANRALFYDRLRQGLSLAQRKNVCLCVMNLDMDGLKAINDRHGHKAGDAAILAMAERITRASRKSDTVARLGGDEFGVILPEVTDAECALQHAARMRDEVRQPLCFQDNPLDMDASIGVALYPNDATEIEPLLDKADQAMYAVKRTRRRR